MDVMRFLPNVKGGNKEGCWGGFLNPFLQRETLASAIDT